MMTMRVRFADATADEGFIDIFSKPLNLKARGNVLEDRTQNQQELRDSTLRVTGLPVSVPTTQRVVEQDSLSEMLEEMSLSTLLYYVLAGEGMNADESA
jgi:hypothetical protein